MRSSLKATSKILFAYWWLFTPFLLVLGEWGFQKEQQFVFYHYSLAFRDQPLAASLGFAKVLFRVWLAITITAAFFELLCQLVTRFFSRLPNPPVRVFLFLIVYAIFARFIFVSKPAISGFYSFYYPKYLFIFATIGFLSSLLLTIRFKFQKEPNYQPFISLSLLILLGLPTLWATKSQPSVPVTGNLSTKTPGPSFFMLGLDGVPGDLFLKNENHKSIAPLWHKHWANKAVQFPNAYAVTNSTYTSWFSILTGQYPYRTGVETLYPTNRRGNADLGLLLPKLLQQNGYRTVFMTDCGATSYMEADFGFDERYQLGPGIFECGRSFLSSRHPLTALFDWGTTQQSLFPELGNFCSALYRPEVFFGEVQRTLERLDKTGQPYFVAAHSCLTHQLLAHAPAVDSPLRKHLDPNKGSPKLDHLNLSVRLADYYLNEVFATAKSLPSDPWSFLLSDHGVRIEKVQKHFKYFTHAVGYPVNRFQYNVPLSILPPKTQTLGTQGLNNLVGLIDLYPTVLSLAKIPLTANDGRSLVKMAASPHPDRFLLLTSTMPIYLDPENPELTSAFWKNTTDKDGFHFFPESLDKELKQKRSVALLKLPYRLVYQPNSPDVMFHELDDPHALRNILGKRVKEATHLKSRLCNHYPDAKCSLNAPTLLGRLSSHRQ